MASCSICEPRSIYQLTCSMIGAPRQRSASKVYRRRSADALGFPLLVKMSEKRLAVGIPARSCNHLSLPCGASVALMIFMMQFLISSSTLLIFVFDRRGSVGDRVPFAYYPH